MKLKAAVRRMLAMCPEAWYIFIRSLQLCAFLLLCAFALLAESERRGGCYELYMTAVSLTEAVQSLLLIAAILPVCIEDVRAP